MTKTSPPDWQRIERSDGIVLLGSSGEDGAHYVLPDGLQLAADSAGRPELRLELVRGASPDLPPAPYGVLELSLDLRYPLAAALDLVRGSDPQATVARATVGEAWLTLRTLGEAEAPADLATAAPLRWNGLERAAWVLRLSADSAALIRRCLEDGAILIEASAQAEVQALAPRLPLRVRGAPAQIVARLQEHAGEGGRISRRALVEYLAGDPGELPFEFQGPVREIPAFDRGERLADLVRTHLAEFAPAADHPEGLLALKPVDSLPATASEWDLSRPERTARALTLGFSPLADARAWALEHPDAELVATSVVPPFATGFEEVAIDASLPAARRGVLETGVTVSIPAKPPQRIQPIVRTLTFEPPADSGAIALRLAPGEPLEYSYTAYAVVRDAGGIEKLTGGERAGRGRRLALSVADFPLRFLSLAASPALLEQAEVVATVTRERGGEVLSERVPLTAAAPAVAIALPSDEEGAEVAIEAAERDGDRVLRLEGTSEALIDLHSFPGYGPHRVEVECEFDGDENLVAIELAPERRTEDPDAVTVVSLTPSAPLKSWAWFSDSPFAPGFRYRPYAGPGSVPASWSEVRDGAEPLLLQAGATV